MAQAHACHHGQIEIVRELVAHGADISLADDKGWTPLIHAASQGQVDVVRELLRNIVDVTLADHEGWTPLIHAAHQGRSDVVMELLSGGLGLDVADNYGMTPLIHAVIVGRSEVARMLILRGADVGIVDPQGGSALRYSAIKGRNIILRELLQHAVYTADDIDEILSIAVKKRFMNCLKEIIKSQCEINVKPIYAVLEPRLLRFTDYPVFTARLLRILHMAGCQLFPLPEKLLTFINQKWSEVDRAWLKAVINNPWCLQQICRRVIRRAVGVRRMCDLDQLPLPRGLIEYTQILELDKLEDMSDDGSGY